ncbi:DUF2721 domain-containing protein [Singulisphaera sp. PoT]|uniref:DUF2721 domain-containing protein n=1 Tax=Singulisphaera sp. PoT TaxID=3411797 RepID=UPI003BF5EB7A
MPIPLPGAVSYATLSAMITPAIFLTANGSLIISTSNRMSRVVDRIRALNELGDKIDRNRGDYDYPADRLNQVHRELDRLVWRSDRIRFALTALYLAFGAFAGTSLTLAVDVWTENRLVAVPTLLAIVGVGLMLVACANLVREAFQALWGNRLEIDFYRDLHRRREAEAASATPSARPSPEPAASS